jgi:hypothetical protein
MVLKIERLQPEGICWMVLIRLSVHDRIYGAEPPIPADLEHEADHERLSSRCS